MPNIFTYTASSTTPTEYREVPHWTDYSQVTSTMSANNRMNGDGVGESESNVENESIEVSSIRLVSADIGYLAESESIEEDAPSEDREYSDNVGIEVEPLCPSNDREYSERRINDFLKRSQIRKVKERMSCCICEKNISQDYICEKCRDVFMNKCARCGKKVDKNLTLTYNDKQFCFFCLVDIGMRKCSDCNTWKQPCREVKDVGFVCAECFEKNKYFKCECCGGCFKMDRYAQSNACISCINRHLEEVNNYSYKPEPKFYNANEDDESRNLFFGVELELGGAEDYDLVNEFAKECGSTFFYMKKDTSIPVYGCEVVTQPATLQRHLRMGGWKVVLDAAKNYGLRADLEKCGIHIHISRSFFTNDECSVLDCFVNTYKEFWKKLARRESHYSAYVEKRVSAWGMQTTDRRCALNLSNANTVELRIFKGTTDYNTLMSYIELCHALSLFVKTISIEDVLNNKEKTIMVFKNVIYNNNYKYLTNYCEQVGCF